MNDLLVLTLLSKEEIWGFNGGQLDVLKKYGIKSAITDLVILVGDYFENSCTYMVPNDNSLKGRTVWCYAKSSTGDGDVHGVLKDGFRHSDSHYLRDGDVCPVLQSSAIFRQISLNRVRGYNGCEEVKYGEYPQYVPDETIQKN